MIYYWVHPESESVYSTDYDGENLLENGSDGLLEACDQLEAKKLARLWGINPIPHYTKQKQIMKLQRPLIFFDLETTGTDIVNDRIVQIAAIKIFPGKKNPEEKKTLVNPGRSIPPESSEVHGITDNDVKDSPRFEQLSKAMLTWFSECDIGGYNSDRFDVPLLAEEFNRCNLQWPAKDTSFIDVLKVEREVNAHTLEATYRRYIGKDLEGAHDALNDVRGTVEVFMKQVSYHPEYNVSPKEVDALLQGDTKRVDMAGNITQDENKDFVWAFGKNKGKRLIDDPRYAKWVLSASFPTETKRIIRKVFEIEQINL